MAENESAPAGEKPPEVTEVTHAGEQPQAGDMSATIGSMSMADLASVLELSEEAAGIPAPETSSPEPQPETKPQGEQPVEVVEEQTEPAPSTTEPKGPPSRIRTGFLPPDQQTLLTDALAAVKAGKATDLPSAFALITGSPVAAPAASTDAEPAPVEAAPATPRGETNDVTALESELTQLRADRRAAKIAFDAETEIDLTEKIEDVTAKLVHARSKVESQALQEQSQRATYNDRFDAAATAVEAKYPETLDGDSVFSRLLADRVDAAKHRRAPELADPDFIMAYADQVAADLGLNKPAPVPPSPQKPARPTGQSLAPGHHAAVRQTPDQIRQAAASLSADELGDAIFTR